MSKVIIPKTYDAKYGIMDTEILIKVTKDFFEKEFLNLIKNTVHILYFYRIFNNFFKKLYRYNKYSQ